MFSKPEVLFFFPFINPSVLEKTIKCLPLALPIACMEGNHLSPLSARAGYAQGGVFCAFLHAQDDNEENFPSLYSAGSSH